MQQPEFKNLSERLKYAMQIRGVSQSELARRIQVTPQAIQYLCSSASEKSKFTPDIADALSVELAWLASGVGSAPNKTLEQNPNLRIPILNYTQLKEWKIESADLDQQNISSWLTMNEPTKGLFGITINDKAMSPRFEIGTIAIIDTTQPLNSNDCYVLAYLHDSDFFVFRQLNIESNTLIPLNNNIYNKITLKPADKIIGICKEARWIT